MNSTNSFAEKMVIARLLCFVETHFFYIHMILISSFSDFAESLSLLSFILGFQVTTKQYSFSALAIISLLNLAQQQAVIFVLSITAITLQIIGVSPIKEMQFLRYIAIIYARASLIIPFLKQQIPFKNRSRLFQALVITCHICPMYVSILLHM